jgi:hypothetical protein
VSTTVKTEHRCPRCGQTKPRTTEHFYFDRADNVTGYCIPCHRAWNRAYYAAGRDPHPERKRAWYRKSRGVPRERYFKRGRAPQEEAS